MSTVDQGKHRVRRNGDIMYRFAHTQGRGVPGDFEDDGPRWVCVGSVQAVSGGWIAQKSEALRGLLVELEAARAGVYTLDIHQTQMQVIEPRWAYFEEGELDLEVGDLRPLLDKPALAPTMNTVVGGLGIHVRRCDAVSELLGALGLSGMDEAAAVSTMRTQAEIEAEVVALRSRYEAIKPNGGNALVERQNLSLRIAALEWVLGREDD